MHAYRRQQSTATDDNVKTFRAVGVVTDYIYPVEHETGRFSLFSSKPYRLHHYPLSRAAVIRVFGQSISVFQTVYIYMVCNSLK